MQNFPDQRSNLPHPLQWKAGILTTGPPGKSSNKLLILISYGEWDWVFLDLEKQSENKRNLSNNAVSHGLKYNLALHYCDGI